MNHKPWQSIFDTYNIHEHDFSKSPFVLTAEQIKKATAHFTSTTEREVRILCKQVVFCGLFTFTLTGRKSAVISRPCQTFFRCGLC
jgi:hypothetical protein